MGKFAGFLKRVKNFMFETIPSKALSTGIKVLNKMNDAYKKYKPLIDAGLHAGFEILGGPIGGTLGGVVADLGLDKISKSIDTLNTVYNTPSNQFLPTQSGDKLNLNDIVNRNNNNTSTPLTGAQRDNVLNAIISMKK